MAIEFERNARPQGTLTSDRRLYANAEGKVVEEKDPKRTTLIVGQGGAVNPQDAQKYGLRSEGGRLTYEGDKGAQKDEPAEEVVPEAQEVVPEAQPEKAPAKTEPKGEKPKQ
jgi:hypothetical protein